MDKGCNSLGCSHHRFAGLISIGLLISLFVGACANVEPAGPYDPHGTLLGKDRHKRNTPPWASMQLSWGKLAAIENWLQGSTARASEYWWVEAQLALGEGRAEFARQDMASGRVDNAIETRITAARNGFSRVKKNSRASRFQRERASRGLAVIQELSKAEVRPPTTITLTQRSTWRARKGRKNNMTRSNNQFRRITVHHSADSITPQLDGSLGSSANALRRLQDVHMDGATTGYGDIGYHFLIDPNGRLFEGRELVWQGAHAGNSTTQSREYWHLPTWKF